MWLLVLAACTGPTFGAKLGPDEIAQGEWAVTWEWETVSDDCIAQNDSIWYIQKGDVLGEPFDADTYYLQRDCDIPSIFAGTCTGRHTLATWLDGENSYGEITSAWASEDTGYGDPGGTAPLGIGSMTSELSSQMNWESDEWWSETAFDEKAFFAPHVPLLWISEIDPNAFISHHCYYSPLGTATLADVTGGLGTTAKKMTGEWESGFVDSPDPPNTTFYLTGDASTVESTWSCEDQYKPDCRGTFTLEYVDGQ